MKDGKKVTPKKNNKSYQNKTAPKVKEVEIEENFLDDDGSDKRLIVFAVIAILVILATIVTLVVGCEKKEEPEPPKPVDPVVVPDKKDEKDKEEDDGVETREIVRKVSAVYTGAKTKEDDSEKESSSSDDEEEGAHSLPIYSVTYFLGEEMEEKGVSEGEFAEEYVPSGYSTCKYYDNEDLENEFDFTNPITEDTHIHMVCEVITYNIVYDVETTNPTEYKVTDGEVTLANLEDEKFAGWFTEENHENQVTVLNKEITGYATEDNKIYLFALFSETECTGENCPVDPTQDSQDAPCDGENCDLTQGESNPDENLTDGTSEENPNEENPTDGTNGENPNEENPTDGTTGENPNEENPTDGTNGEKPNEENPTDGTNEENPNEENPTDGTNGEKPNEENPTDGTNGENSNEENPAVENEGGKASGESNDVNVNTPPVNNTNANIPPSGGSDVSNPGEGKSTVQESKVEDEKEEPKPTEPAEPVEQTISGE